MGGLCHTSHISTWKTAAEKKNKDKTYKTKVLYHQSACKPMTMTMNDNDNANAQFLEN